MRQDILERMTAIIVSNNDNNNNNNQPRIFDKITN